MERIKNTNTLLEGLSLGEFQGVEVPDILNQPKIGLVNSLLQKVSLELDTQEIEVPELELSLQDIGIDVQL